MRLTVAESEENIIRTESVTSWSREGGAAYDAKSNALLSDYFSFVTGARCSNQAENYCIRQKLGGDGVFFIFPELLVSFPLFGRCYCAVLCFLFSLYII